MVYQPDEHPAEKTDIGAAFISVHYAVVDDCTFLAQYVC